MVDPIGRCTNASWPLTSQRVWRDRTLGLCGGRCWWVNAYICGPTYIKRPSPNKRSAPLPHVLLTCTFDSWGVQGRLASSTPKRVQLGIWIAPQPGAGHWIARHWSCVSVAIGYRSRELITPAKVIHRIQTITGSVDLYSLTNKQRDPCAWDLALELYRLSFKPLQLLPHFWGRMEDASALKGDHGVNACSLHYHHRPRYEDI